MTWGGATYNNGGPFIRPLESNPTTQFRLTGPYLFDPNRADGNKVGGTTGSNVKRVSPTSIVGGQMWQNRDIHRWLAGQPLPGTHVQGCTGYAREGGLDVVYVASANAGATSLNLYRYQLTNLANPAVDQISKVGAYAVGVAGQTTCGYDPGHKLFVRTGNNTTPFQFWDLTIAGPNNPDKSVQVNASMPAARNVRTCTPSIIGPLAAGTRAVAAKCSARASRCGPGKYFKAGRIRWIASRRVWSLPISKIGSPQARRSSAGPGMERSASITLSFHIQPPSR